MFREMFHDLFSPQQMALVGMAAIKLLANLQKMMVYHLDTKHSAAPICSTEHVRTVIADIILDVS